MMGTGGVLPRKVRIYFYKDWFDKFMHCYPQVLYCEIYLSCNEFNGQCILEEGGT